MAAKAGLLGLMNALSLEGKEFGILVNSILPFARTMITVDSPAVGVAPDAERNVAMQNELGPRMTPELGGGRYPLPREFGLQDHQSRPSSALAGRYARTFPALTGGWLLNNVDGVTIEDFRDHIGEVIASVPSFEPKTMGGELEAVVNQVRAIEKAP